jgi:aromatic ring-opening dioxygenase catalytic subunit (LigB family)
MAELVGVFAASHAPLLARDWDKLPVPTRDRLAAAYDELGKRFAAAAPDVLIEISPDHWVNFFLDNLPTVCIGVGAEHDGPPEPFMRKVYPRAKIPGHAGLGRHLLEFALAHDFEPSSSHRMALDHGFCIPLWRMALDPPPPIVPMVVNGLEPPMPSVRRCLAWGHLIAEAVASYDEPIRVAVLASGGLSHSIGEPGMGAIDPALDAEFIRLFRDGGEREIADYFERVLPGAGNGGHEVRNWAVAHGAAGSRGFELIAYMAVPEVYVGCGFASWNGK